MRRTRWRRCVRRSRSAWRRRERESLRLGPVTRFGIGVVGLLVYGGVLTPSVVYSSWQCTTNGADACFAPLLPTGTDLALWAFGLPYMLLLISSRLRWGDRVGTPWRRPLSLPWLISILLALMCFAAGAYHLSQPDNWGRLQHVLAWSSWLVLSVYFGVLASVREAHRHGTGEARFRPGRAGAWMLSSGILLYVLMIGANYAEMDVASTFCPTASVCDGPVYLMLGMMILWLCGLPLFIILLLASVRLGGLRPWPRPEPRIALLFATTPFLLLAARDAGLSPERMLLASFWLLVVGWLFLLQHLCGRAAQPA